MADEKPQSGKTRTRSPSYPNVGLEEAIRQAGVLYNQIHDHTVGMEAAAEVWDTNTKSSAFLQGISALKQFGLIEDAGKGDERKVWLSERAKDILIREEGEPERQRAIQEAALCPSIHAELWERYSGNLPPSDSPIRVYLLRERQSGPFHPDHVDGFISQFRSTIAFANLAGSGTIPPRPGQVQVTQSPPPAWREPTVQPQRPASPPPPPPSPQWEPAPSGPAMRELPITLPTSLAVAVFKLPVPMSETDFATLVNSLTAMKDTLVEKKPRGS